MVSRQVLTSPPRTHSQACKNLVKRQEDEPGFLAGRCSHLVAYQCPAGIWTIGWGSTLGVSEGMEITDSEADVRLDRDLAAVDEELNATLFVPVTQGQWDALVSLCYNLAGGPRALPRIAPKLWAALHTGDKPAAAREFLDINKDIHGRQLAGLTRRRLREVEVFLA